MQQRKVYAIRYLDSKFDYHEDSYLGDEVFLQEGRAREWAVEEARRHSIYNWEIEEYTLIV